MKRLLLVGVSLGIVGCAAQEPLIKQTASGHPEATFINLPMEEVQSRMIRLCSSSGLMVKEVTPNQVVCGKTMTGGQAFLAQALMGNSYSTTPEQNMRLVMYQVGSNVNVTGYQWIETQMAFGQMRRENLDTPNHVNGLQRMLFQMGGK